MFKTEKTRMVLAIVACVLFSIVVLFGYKISVPLLCAIGGYTLGVKLAKYLKSFVKNG